MYRRVMVVLVAVVLAGGAVPAQEKKEPVRFTAFAVNMNARARAGVVDIVLERLSSDEERAALIQAFADKGQDAMLRVLEKVKPRVGYIRTPDSLGYDLQYAYRFDNPDGTVRIVIATDRRIGFWEARSSPRTMDYPFTLIEMRLDKSGNGEGHISVATKISKSKDGRTVELENYAISPLALTEIKMAK